MELNWAQRAIPVEVTELPATGWSWQAILTAAISLVALAISVATWRKSGPVTKVRASLRQKGSGPASYEAIEFSATNSGRSETQLIELFFRHRSRPFSMIFDKENFPLNLHPGSEQKISVGVGTICRQVYWSNESKPASVRFFFRTGHRTGRVKLRLSDKRSLAKSIREQFESASKVGNAESASNENFTN